MLVSRTLVSDLFHDDHVDHSVIDNLGETGDRKRSLLQIDGFRKFLEILPSAKRDHTVCDGRL